MRASLTARHAHTLALLAGAAQVKVKVVNAADGTLDPCSPGAAAMKAVAAVISPAPAAAAHRRGGC